MDDLKQQVADKLKQATNILVTVKTDPSIDLLAACIGLSLVLDKIGKHATAVFSGQVPSAMEFLKPGETIEQTPNSLRDFIISLDKSKADKLRYKVEDKVVRIFITPFRAGLTQDDLEFSQGDFNIDLLVALGVHEQAELDAAVTAHGRILHDAAIISINVGANGSLGTLNWQGANVSSVSEMVASLAKVLDPNVFDEQIATALLTGIVAETSRFSNDKTSPETMQIAGDLMAAGANQQLVATELQGAMVVGVPGSVKSDLKPADDNGTLEIKHEPLPEAEAEPQIKPIKQKRLETAPEPGSKSDEPPLPMLAPQENPQSIVPNPRTILPMPDPANAGVNPVSDVAGTPFGGARDEDHPAANEAFLVDRESEVKHGATGSTATNPPLAELPSVPPPAPLTSTPPVAPLPTPEPLVPNTPPAASAPATTDKSSTPPMEDHHDQTLQDIEASVHSSHTEPATNGTEPPDSSTRLDTARQQVFDALKGGPQPLEPLTSLNAQPLGAPLTHDEPTVTPTAPAEPAPAEEEPAQPVTIEVDKEGHMTTLEPAAEPDTPQPVPTATDMPLPPVMPPANNGSTPPSTSTPPPPYPPPITPPSI